MRRIVITLVTGALLLLRPAAAAVPSNPAPLPAAGTVVQVTLNNGMRVILLPNKLAPVATTVMMYGVGSDDDTMPGIAHATEHMMFRGTPNLSAGQLSDIAARIGAQYNAITENESTLYYFKIPASYVNLVMRIEADRMTNASMRDADWVSERPAIEQEVKALESLPGYAIGSKLRETFFKGTPFARTSFGTIAGFDKMTGQDIRSFYKIWYHPANATLIVAGDIDSAATLVAIHTLFDAIPAGTLPVRLPIVIPPLASSSMYDSINFPIGLGAFEYRLPGANDADYAASQVLMGIFSSTRGPMMDLSARGKILAWFALSNTLPETGAGFLCAIPAQGDTSQNALAQVSESLDQFRSQGFPSDLIAASKTRLLSKQSYAQASISELAFTWAEATLIHKTPDVQYALIDKVTDADVNRVMRTFMSPEHQLSVVIAPKPNSAMPHVDPSAGVENVAFTPSAQETLPDWAALALKEPLVAPEDTSKTLNATLANGMRIVVRREITAPVVVLSGVIRTSPDLYEQNGKDGVSSVVEEILPYGTVSLDRKAYQKQLDDIAATVSLGSTFELQVQLASIDRGMRLLADGLLHPAFPQAGFTVAKAAVAQATSLSNSLPSTKADIASRAALYPAGDPRRRYATPQTVAAINLDDVEHYYQIAFRPDETTISIVGDIDPAAAQALVEKYFGDWKAVGPTPTFRYPVITSKKPKAMTVTVKSPTNVQSDVTLRQLIDLRRSDDDYVPFLLANTMLSGEGIHSLLYQSLRTHYGYVYSVDSNVDVQGKGAEFTITFASDPSNVNKAEAAALGIVKQMQTQPMPLVDIQRAKALLLAQRVLPLDSYKGVADYMLQGAKYGYYSETGNSWFWQELVDTTPAQLEHAMRRVQTSKFMKVVVAPE